MKTVLSLILVVALACTLVPVSVSAPSHQIMQGTQIHLTLLSSINTSSTKVGDPFVAVIAEPVYLGSQLLLPAGTRVNGVVGTIEKPRRFSIFRGQAYMNVIFRTVEVDSRLVPVQMSIIAIEQPHGQSDARRRKDVKVTEGQVVQEKHDVKGDIVGATVGTGGGTLIGAVFSHAVRGFGLGLAGSAVYIVARKGKDVELPAQTGLLVRVDNTVSVPIVTAINASYSTTR
jgi:hypothetical protein